MLFKPMIKEINFLKEVQFYECVSSLGAHSTQSPAVFLPKYYGVLNVRDQHRFDDLHLAADRERSGSETKTEQSSFDAQDVGLVTSPSFYIVLENVTAKFRKPCVLDLKIGRQVHMYVCIVVYSCCLLQIYNDVYMHIFINESPLKQNKARMIM